MVKIEVSVCKTSIQSVDDRSWPRTVASVTSAYSQNALLLVLHHDGQKQDPL
jgi:hypothetical protein